MGRENVRFWVKVMKMNKNFEQSMKELEEIAAKLSDGDVSLDESVKLFEDGMKLSQNCQKMLEDKRIDSHRVSHGSEVGGLVFIDINCLDLSVQTFLMHLVCFFLTLKIRVGQERCLIFAAFPRSSCPSSMKALRLSEL